MDVFNSYAKYYDLLYQEKNYEEECDFIEEALRRFSNLQARNILELGCGTGGHAIPLAQRKYQITGIDASKVMLNTAKEKTRKLGLNINLQLSDIRDFKVNRKFDSIICMFAVLNYVTLNSDLEMTLKNVKEHLNEGGLFIIDIWNGLAVMRILPSTRVKIVEKDKTKIIRIVEPELDALNHLCRNHYRLIVLEEGRVLEEIEETHVIRYLFPQEIKHYLEHAGFEVLKICPFPKIDALVDENIWNIAVIARAIG
jgi:2-polyprenyl-3-methyl-5-hydroxy-6-metoxy-1,4-benzoquinol methylase